MQFAESRVERVCLRDGPRNGITKNFLSLAADPTISADDQDDIWHDKKLTRALTWLQRIPKAIPALRRMPSFKNALVQSIAGGNTMVFNRSVKRLLERAALWTWWHTTGGLTSLLPPPAALCTTILMFQLGIDNIPAI